MQVSAQVAEQVDPRDFGLFADDAVREVVVVDGHLGHIRRQIVLKIGLVGVLAQQHFVPLEHLYVPVVGIFEERLMLINVTFVALERTLFQTIVHDEIARVEHLIVQVVGACLILAIAVIVARYLKGEPVVATIAFLAL